MEIVFAIFLINILVSKFLFSAQANTCSSMYTCSDCIQIPSCGWCSRYKATNTTNSTLFEAKCTTLGELANVCESGYEEAPEISVTIVKDIPVMENREGSTIQLQPQEISMKIRTGTPTTISFKFKKADDYPIDIYYLIDNSDSMKKYKSALEVHVGRLASEMKKRTSRLQLGVGRFLDKVTLPYTIPDSEIFKQACKDCAEPYSYKNHMALSNDTDKFSEVLLQSKMSKGEDWPEGGFDGLLQTMVCSDEINWRNYSRRIIVFCTDANFHVAGDGKLGGIVMPNDGKCHLDKTGEYTHGLELDYPSISQINEKAKEGSMNIIFAVTAFVRTKYTLLAKAIEGATCGNLESGEDVINLVIKQFNSMSVSLSLTDNSTGSVGIEYQSKCPGKNWTNAKGCSNLKGGDEVEFQATIVVNNCSISDETVEIKPIGMMDSLIVHLKVHCNCGCETPGHKAYSSNATECSKGGNLVCGHCDCHPPHYGRKCECKEHDLSNIIAGLDNCRKGNVTCSGRGQCICGRCRCEQPSHDGRVTGEFCQCDNFSCPRGSSIKNLCSGQGLCVCGECICNEGWSKEDCSCSKDQRQCQMMEGDKICSGRGDCVCGKCECHEMSTTGNRYSGTYCERCTECKAECSKEISDCLRCKIFSEDPSKLCPDCYEIFQNTTFVTDASGRINASQTSSLCREVDDFGCSFQYVPYTDDHQELRIFSDKEKECPKPVNIVAITTGVAASTVAAGILLLLSWKLLTTVHDRREYEKFEKQRATTKWVRLDNPLYRRALTSHMNPTFQG